MKKRLTAIFLVMIMLLSCVACGKQEPAEETVDQKESATAVSNGTLSDDSVVIAVGKTQVTYNEFKIYYNVMKDQYEETLTDALWSYQTDTAQKTVGQEAIEDVVRMIIQVKVIAKAAAADGTVLEADEKEEADHNAQTICEGMDEDTMKQKGITQALLTQVFEENKLAQKMYNVVTGKVDVNVLADQAKAARVQLIYLPYTDGNKETVRATAENLSAQAKKLEGNFYKFAKENTQGTDDIECLVGQMDTRTNLASAVLALKQYETTGVVEESDGFYIAYCVETSNKTINEEYKNDLIAERQVKAFQEAYSQWSENYGVRVSKSLLADKL